MRKGDLVRDLASGRVGELVGKSGPYLLLSALDNGAQWKAHPLVAQKLTAREALELRVTAANRRSRGGGLAAG